MRKFIFLLALLMPIFVFAQVPRMVEIRGVHDGDSYLIKLDTAKNDTLHYIRVRLLGCNSPEVWSPYSIEQPFGTMTGDTMRAMFRGQKALLIDCGLDKYKRTLGKLYVGDTDLTYMLLINGWANYKTSKKLDATERSRYKKARDSAKRKKLGIWNK